MAMSLCLAPVSAAGLLKKNGKSFERQLDEVSFDELQAESFKIPEGVIAKTNKNAMPERRPPHSLAKCGNKKNTA